MVVVMVVVVVVVVVAALKPRLRLLTLQCLTAVTSQARMQRVSTGERHHCQPPLLCLERWFLLLLLLPPPPACW